MRNITSFLSSWESNLIFIVKWSVPFLSFHSSSKLWPVKDYHEPLHKTEELFPFRSCSPCTEPTICVAPWEKNIWKTHRVISDMLTSLVNVSVKIAFFAQLFSNVCRRLRLFTERQNWSEKFWNVSKICSPGWINTEIRLCGSLKKVKIQNN